MIDNEILGMTMRVLRGIEVDDDSLALEVIDQVGPGGHFLMADHTVRHMRSEFYYPSPVVDRQGWERWQQAGGLDARERARQIARQIMAAITRNRARATGPGCVFRTGGLALRAGATIKI